MGGRKRFISILSFLPIADGDWQLTLTVFSFVPFHIASVYVWPNIDRPISTWMCTLWLTRVSLRGSQRCCTLDPDTTMYRSVLDTLTTVQWLDRIANRQMPAITDNSWSLPMALNWKLKHKIEEKKMLRNQLSQCSWRHGERMDCIGCQTAETLNGIVNIFRMACRT